MSFEVLCQDPRGSGRFRGTMSVLLMSKGMHLLSSNVAEQTSTASGNDHVVALKVSKEGVHRQQVWPYICPKIPGMEE